MTAAHAVPPLVTSPIADAAALAPVDRGRALFDLLRAKWKEVPAGIYDRADTTKLLQLADWELRDYWDSVWAETSTGPGYATRGWYQELYRDQFCGKRVLEIGSGCGVDGIHFIRNGAKWYFADIVPSNLKLIRRILGSFGLDCEGMTYLEDLGCIDQIPDGFDFIYCNGSMINVPFAFASSATLALASRLKPGGRWVERCHTRARWTREGRLPFADWGKVTDGDAAPWAEWYDTERLRDRFAPLAFEPLLAFSYSDDDHGWFDLRLDEAKSPDAWSDDAAVISLTALLRRHQGRDVAPLAPAVPVCVRAVPVEALDRSFGYQEPPEGIQDEDALLDYFERNHRGDRVLIAGAAGWDEFAPASTDIVLIDGAQGADALRRDTDRAIGLLRPGGLMLWRGFCPQSDALQAYPEARALALAVHQGWRSWAPSFATMFWVSGSHLLVGVKR